MNIFFKVIGQSFLLIIFVLPYANGKTKLQLSGELDSRINFFVNDSTVFTDEDYAKGNVPKQYLADKFQDRISTETWLTLLARYKNFSFKTRFDFYRNSNARNPIASYSDYGIGLFNLNYKTQKMDIQVGSIYTQFGNGFALRSFEERDLLIDNAIIGGYLGLNLNAVSLKFIGGFQKTDPTTASKVAGIFTTLSPYFAPVIGADVNYSFQKKNLVYLPGFSVVHRIQKKEVLNEITALNKILNIPDTSFKKATTIFNLYGTLSGNSYSWTYDLGYKTKEPTVDYSRGIRGNEFLNRNGYSFYSSFNYFKNKFSALLQLRGLSFYEFRVAPVLQRNDGFVAFFAPLSKLNARRLTGRYVPNTQYHNEVGYQIDVFYNFKKLKTSFNLSDIRTFENLRVFWEFQNENEYKFSRKVKSKFGIQFLKYNQLVNQGEGDMVDAVVPFFDVRWKRKRNEAILGELSYMHTEDDLGSWVWASIEYQKKNFTISAGDMYNSGNKDPDRRLHYYTFNASYKYKNLVINGGYVRQPETVVCTGGVCRTEPAFIGGKIKLKYNF